MMGVLASGEEPSRYLNIDIKYRYVVFRKDGKVQDAYRVPAGSRVLRLSRIRRHVEKRINLIAARMSGNPGDAKTMVFKLCNGTADTPVYTVVPAYHVTPENEAIVSTPYGAILEIECGR